MRTELKGQEQETLQTEQGLMVAWDAVCLLRSLPHSQRLDACLVHGRRR